MSEWDSLWDLKGPELEEAMTTGAIHESDFIKIEIAVPSIEEQRRIGAFLDNLDNLITLHQREYNIKKWRQKC